MEIFDETTEAAATEAENLQRVLEGRKRVVSEELKKDEEKLKPSVEEPKVELKSEVEPVFKVEEQKVTAVKKESKVAFPAILSSPLLSKKHHPSPLSFSFSSSSHEMVYQGSKILKQQLSV